MLNTREKRHTAKVLTMERVTIFGTRNEKGHRKDVVDEHIQLANISYVKTL
jgi:hypothetical protein